MMTLNGFNAEKLLMMYKKLQLQFSFSINNIIVYLPKHESELANSAFNVTLVSKIHSLMVPQK